MSNSKEPYSEVLFIKNMFCQSCLLLLKEKFEAIGITVKKMTLGQVEIATPKNPNAYELIDNILTLYGFELVHNREDQIVEKIKLAVIELIHHLNNTDSIIRKSDYLVEKLGLSYQYLSKLFSEKEHITLEKYIILHKIERIKHLIDEENLTLSEIAYLMDYSSVQYLSNQFKAITGITVSQYKESDRSSKKAIDRL